MAENITRLGRTSGNNWTTLATGPCEIDSIIWSLPSGSATITLEVTQGATTALLQSPLQVAGSARMRAGVIVLGAGNILRGRSDNPVDWVLGGVAP